MHFRANWLCVFLAFLTALLLSTASSALAGSSAQNRVGAFAPATQPLTWPTAPASTCTRPGLIASTAGMTAGFCVAAEDGLAPIAGGAPKYPFTMSDSQFGAKLAQHAGDFGLDPSNPADRAAFEQIIRGIGGDAEQEVTGTFRDQGPGGTVGPVLFRITGSNVVVTTPQGEFVTVLQGGISNPSVQAALEAAGQ